MTKIYFYLGKITRNKLVSKNEIKSNLLGILCNSIPIYGRKNYFSDHLSIRRNYSNHSFSPGELEENNSNFSPVKLYKNADLDKLLILKENKGKLEYINELILLMAKRI